MNLGNDHLCWDGAEQATLLVRLRGGGERAVGVPLAKRRNIRLREKSPSSGVYIGAEINWHVPQRDLPAGIEPKPGDAIEDRQQRQWTVLTVARNRLGHTWTLGCVDLVIAHDLRDLVTIQRPQLSYDAAGVASKQWLSRYTDVPARVQSTTQSVSEERAVRAARQAYEVVVARQLADVDLAVDRIEWRDPQGETRYLDMVGFRQPDRIDELPVIEAELRL